MVFIMIGKVSSHWSTSLYHHLHLLFAGIASGVIGLMMVAIWVENQTIWLVLPELIALLIGGAIFWMTFRACSEAPDPLGDWVPSFCSTIGCLSILPGCIIP